MSLVYLSLGSNLGEREQNLNRAINELYKLGKVLAISHFFETKPYGYHNQPDFLNCAVALETSLSPELLLEELKGIEKELGRENKGRWRERIIDIDIIFYDHIVYKSETLVIPHPDMQYREFVLRPLAEIAKDFIHPVLKKSIETLLEELKELPYVDVIQTPVGYFYMAARGNFIVETSFREIKGRKEKHELLQELKSKLQKYFQGEKIDFLEFPLNMQGITSFHQKVYHYLRNFVPWGHVITYGELAERVGCPKGARAIGNAMAHNPFPILIPCHRVLLKGNKIGGFGGGAEWKKYLLRIEGINI
ncbi:MAG: 2-amino-4-hydroxy-6-hydroxymethyldihydropteridine diphosphokinase [Candidatus Hydrothermia bacterium]